MSAPPRESRGRWLAGCAVAAALVAAVLAVYRAVGGFDFVRYDDPDYVLENPAVLGGLTAAGARWAFTSAHASNWHPLTWLSHMLDVELFGLAPAGHHWMAVALHALAAVLCFAALARLTGRTVASAWVAFLFALHPLRVESVAWVSERKDVLSGVLFFALLCAYAGWARRPRAWRYAVLVALLALGLMAKPMLVTAPFVLLLLDAWPLGRLAPGARDGGPRRALLEKLPLVALAALASAAAVWSQRLGGSLYTLEAIPLAERLANAPVAVLRYLAHFVWPARLAYFYPHPAMLAERASPWTAGALLALGALLAMTGLALAARRRAPELAVGWLWFLGMLVPVIGVVQVGEQALADRYAYLPVVGLQLALVFSLDRALRAPAARRVAAALGAVVLAALAARTTRQAETWRDSGALFRNALAVDARTYPAWVGLANEHAARGELAEARGAYESALAVRPTYAPALYGLGLLAQRSGAQDEALALYERALAALPGLAAAHLNRGTILAERGDRVAAAQEFESVLALFPEHPDAHYDLALLLLSVGEEARAREHLERCLAARPGHPGAWTRLAELAEARGDHPAVLAALEHALASPADPAWPGAARLAAWVLATAEEPDLRDPPRAVDLARRAAQLTGRRDPAVLEALAAALAAAGDPVRAATVQAEAVALLPAGRTADARARHAQYERGEAHVHRH